MCGHVGQTLLGLRLRFVLADFDQQNLFGLPQERERVPHGAAAFTRILPSDDHAAKRQCSGGVGHQQNGTTGPQHDNPGVGLVPAAPATDDEEIRRPGFPQEKLAGGFKGAAPFDLPQRAALGAKLLAPLLEAHHHPLKVVLVGFAQLDVSSHERRPSAQPATPIRAAWKRSARPIASSTLCSESCSTSTWTISAAKDNGSSCLP